MNLPKNALKDLLGVLTRAIILDHLQLIKKIAQMEKEHFGILLKKLILLQDYSISI